MIGCGIDIVSAMVLTHPVLFEKWTKISLEKKKVIENIKVSLKFRDKAKTLAKLMIEKNAWKRQLVILENLSSLVLKNSENSEPENSETEDENGNEKNVQNGDWSIVAKNLVGYVNFIDEETQFGSVVSLTTGKDYYFYRNGFKPRLSGEDWSNMAKFGNDVAFDVGKFFATNEEFAFNLVILHQVRVANDEK